ncbi:hypothetical protein POX_f08341 [Penicillium oxalicum]|uniref:hypothetical protein n=1 Tax=Penicillium oxalicum TaxID=69781 RepID=UPI0020B74409|nr:hypothetical protein POX_f08341 [Penicillium oxalicum]KAI2787959.1 hypothetical protein POX_f08341 [Penicillium oxalicum]
MLYKSLALMAGVTLAVADTTVTLFLPGYDSSQSIEAKILGSSNSMTTYDLHCAPEVGTARCGIPATGLTVMEGESTFSLNSTSGKVTSFLNCQLGGTTTADCVAVYVMGTFSSTSHRAVDLRTETRDFWLPVHVTASENGAASATTGASASASTPSMTDASAESTTGTASSLNAAMPAITGNAVWVAGGAAAAIAMAAL